MTNSTQNTENQQVKTYTTYKVGSIKLTKVTEDFYCGHYTTSGGSKFDIFLDKDENNNWIGYCKQFKNIKVSSTIKGCCKQIEKNLRTYKF